MRGCHGLAPPDLAVPALRVQARLLRGRAAVLLARGDERAIIAGRCHCRSERPRSGPSTPSRAAAPAVRLDGRAQVLRRRGRGRRRRPRDQGRRVLHAARAFGLRQDDDAAADRGFRAPGRGATSSSTAATSPDTPPYARDVNTVFQDYALFPHMTIAENVGYGLRVSGRAAQGAAGTRGRGAPADAAPRRRQAQARRSSPAGSASGSRSPARSSTGPRCCSSTSRSARST